MLTSRQLLLWRFPLSGSPADESVWNDTELLFVKYGQRWLSFSFFVHLWHLAQPGLKGGASRRVQVRHLLAGRNYTCRSPFYRMLLVEMFVIWLVGSGIWHLLHKICRENVFGGSANSIILYVCHVFTVLWGATILVAANGDRKEIIIHNLMMWIWVMSYIGTLTGECVLVRCCAGCR